MKRKVRKQQILACICALQIGACAMIQEDTQAPMDLISPNVMAMIQQDAINKVHTDAKAEGHEAVNPNAISVGAMLKGVLENAGVDVPTEGISSESANVTKPIPVPSRKPDVKAG